MARSISASFSSPLQTSLLGAQALWWPCTGRLPPSLVFLFIVGNPGLSSYYTPFLTALHASSSLRGRIEILCVSHRGHTSLPSGSHPFYGSNEGLGKAASKGQKTGLKDQIAHKVAVLDTLRAVYPKGAGNNSSSAAANRESQTKIIVGGHSVGAYIALEMLKQRPDHVDGLHLYFPTLSWIGKTPNARRLSLLFYPLVPSFILPIPLFLLSLLPLMILLPLIRILANQPRAAARTTAELLTTKGAVRNALKMAAEEMKQIGRIDEEAREAVNKLQKRGGSVRAYYSKGEEDGWVPSWLREQTEQALGLERLVLPASLSAPLHSNIRPPSHSFSIDDIRASRRLNSGATTIMSPAVNREGILSPVDSPSPLRTGTGGLTGLTTATATATTPTLRRRKSLLNAKARRSLTGGIIIETEGDGLEDDEEASSAALIEEMQHAAAIASGGGKGKISRGTRDGDGDGDEIDRPNPRGMLFSNIVSPSSNPMITASIGGDEDKSKTTMTMVKSPEEELQDIFSAAVVTGDDSSNLTNRDRERERGRSNPSTSTSTTTLGRTGIKAGKGAGAGRNSRPLLTSTVCAAGMPHAFCLRHGEHMARITAAWLSEEVDG